MSGHDRADRAYDIVLHGATGFTGGLTAEYLAAHAPEGLRWAIAGRDSDRLERLRERLPGGAGIGVLRADSTDPGSLRELAHQTHVAASAAGPYLTHGEGLVAACAEAGTDYADLCGEPEFVDLVYVRHDARARETGAHLVHACGFESVPHDLGAYFTVRQLPEGVPLTVDGFVHTDAAFSGGTFASALNQFARAPRMQAAARDRERYEPRTPGRRVRAPPGPPWFAGEVSMRALPLPTIDAQVVRSSARALPRYGPDFRYRHCAGVRSQPVALGGAAVVGAVAAAAQLPSARRWLGGLLRPGQGPDADKRARSRFSVRFVGEGGGVRVFTEVAGGDRATRRRRRCSRSRR